MSQNRRFSLENKNVTILDPNVIVFHNVLSDPDDYIDYYEENADWRGWYGFGRQVDCRAIAITGSPAMPTMERIEEEIIEAGEFAQQDKYLREVAEVFLNATEFYIAHTGKTLPNWSIQPWGLARYIPDENLIGNDELTMNYHTDYVIKDSESPGSKFAITAVIYPNDDYEGGEISFRVIGDSGIEKEFDYKPKAGDMVMFPAEHPYYHGVRRLYKAPKYITRLYWSYEYEGSEVWHKLSAKYGDKFQELESQRLKRHDLMISQPYLRPAVSMEEYYNLLESGELLDDYSTVLDKRDHEQ